MSLVEHYQTKEMYTGIFSFIFLLLVTPTLAWMNYFKCQLFFIENTGALFCLLHIPMLPHS